MFFSDIVLPVCFWVIQGNVSKRSQNIKFQIHAVLIHVGMGFQHVLIPTAKCPSIYTFTAGEGKGKGWGRGGYTQLKI